MRVNFHKSEIVAMNLSEELAHDIFHLFAFPLGSFPIKYLGVPAHYNNLRREDIQPLVDKLLRRIAGWRGKLLSYAAKVVLIRACLTSIPIYLTSFIKFPKWAIKMLNTHLANCLWNDSADSNKIHLVNWDSISMLKDFGGLGIPNLRDLNICLLASWIKRYNIDNHKMWKQFLDFKYKTENPNIFCSSTPCFPIL